MRENVISERLEHIGVVRLQRPGLNTLTLAALEALVAALETHERDSEVRCLLLTGSERAFCAGLDAAELADLTMLDLLHRNLHETWERLRRLQKPLIAAVSGYAAGAGCALMLAADLAFAADTARFSLPEVALGALPAFGGAQRLARTAGRAVAMDLVLTGRTLTAREALQVGLVSRVVPREQVYAEALTVGRELAARPPLALRLAKEAILKAEELPLSEAMAFERHLFHLLFATADLREGLRAFLEQRSAVFMGR